MMPMVPDCAAALFANLKFCGDGIQCGVDATSLCAFFWSWKRNPRLRPR